MICFRWTTLWPNGLATLFSIVFAGQVMADPLPSWENNATKQRIIEFVQQVVRPESKQFVPIEDRVAVFDHDGTLLVEQPVYVQWAFGLDRVKVLAKDHPTRQHQPTYRAVIDGDKEAMASFGALDWIKILILTHTGMPRPEFKQTVADWMATAQHSGLKRGYRYMVYQPMLELLHYLKQNGFRCYIVTGGENDFIRAFAESLYGVPPEQVIGSRVKTDVIIDDEGDMALSRVAQMLSRNEEAEKVVNIDQVTGRRPIFAVGNSDGDYDMLLWTSTNAQGGLSLLIHHTDGAREYQYDRKSQIGRLTKTLDEAEKHRWQVVDMKTDWRTIFVPLPENTPPKNAPFSSKKLRL